MEENYKKELTAILDEAIGHFDPSSEDDVSMLTIIADIDSNQLIFGGLKLREDMEEYDEYNDESQIFYTAKPKYLKDYYKTIDEDAYGLFNGIGEIIDANEDLRDKFDGLLLYGWCKVNDEYTEVDNFWSA